MQAGINTYNINFFGAMVSIILMIGGLPALLMGAVLSFLVLTGGCGLLGTLFVFFSLQEKSKKTANNRGKKMAAIFFMYNKCLSWYFE